MSTNYEILCKQLKQGSVSAFDALYKIYSGKLYNFLMKLSNGNTYASEEILQLVFIKIWEMRKDIDTEKSFNAYLSTIARNLLMNTYRHESVEFIYREYFLAKYTEASSAVEEQIEYHFLEEYLDKLIEQLPPARREVYILSRLKNYTNKQISEKLNKSESTIEKQIAQANEFIRTNIRKHYDKIFEMILFFYLTI